MAVTAVSIEANAVIISTGSSSSMFADRVEHREAVHAGHHHVDDHRVERRGAHDLEALGARRGEPHAVALARQQRLEDLAHDLFVVDDENRALTSHGDAALPGYWPAP